MLWKTISSRLNPIAQANLKRNLQKSIRFITTLRQNGDAKNRHRYNGKQESRQMEYFLIPSVPAFALSIFSKSDDKSEPKILTTEVIDFNVLYLSYKTAQMNEAQGKTKEATTNYNWTVEKLIEIREKQSENADLNELWRSVNNS